jgi:hypothetical protein
MIVLVMTVAMSVTTVMMMMARHGEKKILNNIGGDLKDGET